jgi:hypothetical protein
MPWCSSHICCLLSSHKYRTYHCFLRATEKTALLLLQSLLVQLFGQRVHISDDYKGNIPDIFTFEGLLHVLSLCNLMELANVIHYKSYTDEGIGTSERHKMITGQACAQKIRKWLAANVEIHDPHDVSSLRSLDNDVFYPYLAAQGHVEFQLKNLVVQIDWAFFQDTQFKAHYDLTLDPKTFNWVGTAYQVQPVKGENFDDCEWLVAQRNLRVIGGAQVVQDEDKAGQPPKKHAHI